MIGVVNEYNKKWALKQILQKCTIVVFHYGHMCLYLCSDYSLGFIKEFWMYCSKWTIIEPHAKAAEYTINRLKNTPCIYVNMHCIKALVSVIFAIFICQV